MTIQTSLMRLITATLAVAAASTPASAETSPKPEKIPTEQSADRFNRYFEDKTMRFDFYHCGDAHSQEYYFDEIREEPYWAGSKKGLIDDTNYGVQMLKIIDKASGKVIYSRGYNTLFNEWQTIPEAQSIRKAMPESVVFPYPRAEVRLELYARNEKGIFEKRFEQEIDPSSYFIRKFSPHYDTFEVAYTGNPDTRIDIVLIPEGYTVDQRAKFEQACERFADELLSYSPFKENAHRFNIRAVWAPSAESGVTIPGEHVWRNTATGAAFYTFGSERYQMIEDFQALRDIAGHAPYDYIYVLSNTQKYGGGGIFNFYGISAAHHPTSTSKVYVHEFGHLLLGLGDEYTEDTPIDGVYPTRIEPWEANLTTLVDFDRKPAWRRLIKEETPIPTPLPADDGQPWPVGAYEGGGYLPKGIYRPWPNCMMNNIHTIDIFCPVCTEAITRYIDFLCQ